MTPQEQINNALIDWEFKARHGRSIKYLGEMTIKGVKFPLEISNVDESFIELPEVVLTKIPPELPELLPHKNYKGVLCYLDREGVFLDRYRPTETINLIMNRVRTLLTSYLDPSAHSKEFADEFITYWDWQYHCYLLSKEKKGKPVFARIFKRISKSEKEVEEVAVGAEDELDGWQVKRNSIDKKSKTHPAVIIKMEKPPLIPSGMQWPPNSLK